MIKHRRYTFYKIAVVLFVVGCYLLFLYTEQTDDDNNIKIMHIERSIRSVVNRGECRFPQLPVDNPEIMKFYKPVEKINCGSSIDWVMCEKSICFVKPQVSAIYGDIECSYTDLIRKNDFKSRYGKVTKTKEPYVLQTSDFVRVSCRSESGVTWTGMAFGIRDTVTRHIPINNNAFLGEPPIGINGMNMNLNGDEVKPLYYNVLMFGFDSLSRNAFIRKLPKTYQYLKQDMQAIILQGYNIIGDGTPQALIPILTGYTELELPETRKRMANAKMVNIYPFIWNDFSNQGYITSFNEDIPQYGTFSYRLTGFGEEPVDHYLRTFYVEAENLLSSSKSNCIGHYPDHMVMMDYTKNFMAKYSESPRFIFSFHGGLSHDSINLIGAADDDVLHWLSTMRSKKLLDNTILIFMSDHGNRFSDVRATLQGKQEERLPFFSFAFPESFKKHFPTEYENFLVNSERLTTPFDIHATFKHLLRLQNEKTNLKSKKEDETSEPLSESMEEGELSQLYSIGISSLASNRAISLFDPIPENRSCADAYIEPHWCACLQWQPIQINDTSNQGLLLKLSGSMLEAINNATHSYRSYCAMLELHSISWVMRLTPHKELLQFKQSSDKDGFIADLTHKVTLHEEMYQMQIFVIPGNSIFEATVTLNVNTFKARTKLSDISRINKYGSQANCIYDRNPELRKYCYCLS